MMTNTSHLPMIQPATSPLTHIGFYDDGQILLAQDTTVGGPLLADDVVTSPDGRVWRVMADGRGWDISDDWQWQADSRLLADLEETYFDAGSAGQS